MNDFNTGFLFCLCYCGENSKQSVIKRCPCPLPTPVGQKNKLGRFLMCFKIRLSAMFHPYSYNVSQNHNQGSQGIIQVETVNHPIRTPSLDAIQLNNKDIFVIFDVSCDKLIKNIVSVGGCHFICVSLPWRWSGSAHPLFPVLCWFVQLRRSHRVPAVSGRRAGPGWAKLSTGSNERDRLPPGILPPTLRRPASTS